MPNRLLTFQDITSTYKYPERSSKERMTMEKALRQSDNTFARYYLNDSFNDVKFDFDLLEDIKIGQPFNVVSFELIYRFTIGPAGTK